METIFFFPSPPFHSSVIAILSEKGGLSIVVWGGFFGGRWAEGKNEELWRGRGQNMLTLKNEFTSQGLSVECQQRTDASNSWSIAARRREPSSRSQEATLGSRQAWDDPLQWVPRGAGRRWSSPGSEGWLTGPVWSHSSRKGTPGRQPWVWIRPGQCDREGGLKPGSPQVCHPPTNQGAQPGFWASHKNRQGLPKLSFWRKNLIFTACLHYSFQSMDCFYPHAQIHLLHNISVGNPKVLIQKDKDKDMGRR